MSTKRAPECALWFIRRSVVALLVAAAVLGIGSAADAAQVVGAGRAITLELNKGKLVRLDRPADTVFIADPEICDIQVKSASLVYLFAKKAGVTTLYAVDKAERVLANFEITVSPNLTRLRDAVRNLYPDADISLSSVERHRHRWCGRQRYRFRECAAHGCPLHRRHG